jgi:type VI secretion system protein ImpM
MSHESTSAPGWYGKLSSLGDFASRRLPPEWVQACDGWLSRSMSASRVQLDADWLDIYLSAPVWRFAWAPGIVDRRWWFGVLMPSCDNVGRYFPLVVAQPRDRPPFDRIGLDHLELWWSHVASAAMLTLQDHVAVDDFEVELAGAPPWPAARALALTGSVQVEDRLRVSGAAGAALVELAGAWASQEMIGRLAGCSIWWPMARAAENASITVHQGLPDAARFAELLTGHW